MSFPLTSNDLLACTYLCRDVVGLQYTTPWVQDRKECISSEMSKIKGTRTINEDGLSTKMVIQRGLQLVIRHGKCHIAECLVGDEKRIIIFTARNEQVNILPTKGAHCRIRFSVYEI
ncbi:predicted protein [Arabidopsis lyrata subsp. lyrata]|uniref:Predicted protein n=1 Tax=Arabidopsis lyrata subsp. lyrata TaxID=81972 RepID=D7KWU9_ARALL|nr:predicted protein [Arabidopsis lyrata subsp. lyrata]